MGTSDIKVLFIYFDDFLVNSLVLYLIGVLSSSAENSIFTIQGVHTVIKSVQVALEITQLLNICIF
jgi:hypothetical protein